MIHLIKHYSTLIYHSIDSFFRDDIRVQEHRRLAVTESPLVIQIDHFEWELNQGYSDIAARDAMAIFNSITPYFLRKFIASLHNCILLFLLTDEENEIQHFANQENKCIQLTKKFTIIIGSKIDRLQSHKSCIGFLKYYREVLCKIRLHSAVFYKDTLYIVKNLLKIDPPVIHSDACKIRRPVTSKLISNFFFHKRN